MAHYHSPWLRACRSLFLVMAYMRGGAFADSGTVQVDLVFPRNATTYQPVYPFPIVFAVHNVSLIWPYSFFIKWRLDDVETGNTIADDIFKRERSQSEIDSDDPSNGDVPADQWLLIFSTSELINATFSELSLSTTVSLQRPCDEEYWETQEIAKPDKSNARSFNQAISFRLDPEGDLPNIEAEGPCPLPIGATLVSNQLESDKFGACPLLGDNDDEPHPVETCAISIGADAASNVASRMLNDSSCTIGDWPDPTGLLGPCIEDDSGAERSLVRLFPFLAVVFVIVAF